MRTFPTGILHPLTRQIPKRPAGRTAVAATAAFAACLFGSVQTASASFHLMQIEQIIGGVNGDQTAQAIQLRMRAPGQIFVSLARLRIWDASGQNPILITDFPNNVTAGAMGDRILIASTSFLADTSPNAIPDFMMDNLIPQSYLSAGRLTFEDDSGTILWMVCWGGSNYTGGTIGSLTNDADGQFAPIFNSALPSSTAQSLFFIHDAGALSTNNAADYIVSSGAAVFTNNADQAFTVGGPTFTFSIQGSCPGTEALSWFNASSNGTVALIFATGTGNLAIPTGNPCAGTRLGLGAANARLVNTFGAGANGARTVNGTANAGACGGFLQLLDLPTCDTSNVAQLP